VNPDNLILKWILAPVSLLFGCLVSIKNLLYRTGFLSGIEFVVPVIAVGNLSVGGTGKTPHVEYLVRLLRSYVRVAVMSRGYGRRTRGFLFVRREHQSADVGDEALIFARKYGDVLVAVSESRSVGIPMLMQHRPETQAVLLDDAFQHRSVSPYLSILLTEFDVPFYSDWLLPSGTLREWRSGYLRADILIVTKCPLALSPDQRDEVIRKINPQGRQAVYFSAYRYHHPYAMFDTDLRVPLTREHSVLLVCGIAKTTYLTTFVESKVSDVEILRFEDHYEYQQDDIEMMLTRFQNLSGSQKIFLTTEKDAGRIEPFARMFISAGVQIFLLPVEVVFLFDDGLRFDNQIRTALLDFKI
jgi:tetraacyldisaccharide 4'-kinase